jgi:Chromosome segregation during meiosis
VSPKAPLGFAGSFRESLLSGRVAGCRSTAYEGFRLFVGGDCRHDRADGFPFDALLYHVNEPSRYAAGAQSSLLSPRSSAVCTAHGGVAGADHNGAHTDTCARSLPWPGSPPRNAVSAALPYVGSVQLGEGGVRLTKRRGLLHLTVVNPHGTPKKSFLVRYHLDPACQHTTLRQVHTTSSGSPRAHANASQQRPARLQYAVQLHLKRCTEVRRTREHREQHSVRRGESDPTEETSRTSTTDKTSHTSHSDQTGSTNVDSERAGDPQPARGGAPRHWSRRFRSQSMGGKRVGPASSHLKQRFYLHGEVRVVFAPRVPDEPLLVSNYVDTM